MRLPRYQVSVGPLTVLSFHPAIPFSLDLPYANYVFRLPSWLPSSPPEDITRTLSQAFVQLLDLVIATIRQNATQPGPPSYNVVLTLEHLHLIPRSQENYVISQTGEVRSFAFQFRICEVLTLEIYPVCKCQRAWIRWNASGQERRRNGSREAGRSCQDSEGRGIKALGGRGR